MAEWIRHCPLSVGGQLPYSNYSDTVEKKDVARLKNFFDHGIHKLTLELWDITTVLHFRPRSVIGSGLTHARFVLEGKKGFSDIIQR